MISERASLHFTSLHCFCWGWVSRPQNCDPQHSQAGLTCNSWVDVTWDIPPNGIQCTANCSYAYCLRPQSNAFNWCTSNGMFKLNPAPRYLLPGTSGSLQDVYAIYLLN